MTTPPVHAQNTYGSIVRIDPHFFVDLLKKSEHPVVIEAVGGFFRTHYRYITNYQGITFYTRSDEKLALPSNVFLIKARKIYVPSAIEIWS